MLVYDIGAGVVFCVVRIIVIDVIERVVWCSVAAITTPFSRLERTIVSIAFGDHVVRFELLGCFATLWLCPVRGFRVLYSLS